MHIIRHLTHLVTQFLSVAFVVNPLLLIGTPIAPVDNPSITDVTHDAEAIAIVNDFNGVNNDVNTFGTMTDALDYLGDIVNDEDVEIDEEPDERTPMPHSS